MISWADVLRAELEEQNAIATLAAATHARIKARLEYHTQSDAERAAANLASRNADPPEWPNVEAAP